MVLDADAGLTKEFPSDHEGLPPTIRVEVGSSADETGDAGLYDASGTVSTREPFEIQSASVCPMSEEGGIVDCIPFGVFGPEVFLGSLVSFEDVVTHVSW